MKEFLDSVKSKIKSDTVFLIGGGPSVSRLISDPRMLDDKDIIVGNNAYKLFPNALLLHFMDWKWITWHMEPEHDVFNNFKGPITCCADDDRARLESLSVKVFYKGSRSGVGGLVKDPNKLEGHNTGHQMINIAYHLGFKNVLLLGYDMKPEKNTNWHQDHKVPSNVGHYSASMIPGMHRIAKQLPDYDMNVYNLNSESFVKCFPFSDIEEWL